MNVSVITCWSPSMEAVAQLTTPTHREFAERNNFAYESRAVPQDEGAVWDKIAMISDHLSQEAFDYVFWIDVDAAVTNPGFDLSALAASHPDKSVIATADIHGLNMGVALYRRNLLTRQLHYAVAGHGKKLFEGYHTPEQFSYNHFLAHEPYLGVLGIVSQRTMNSYWRGAYEYPGAESAWWEPGDFVLHTPGLSNERRVEIFSEALLSRPVP
jgi:hypothetical protein